MDAATLEDILTRLSLDGTPEEPAEGVSGFPLLRFGSETLYAHPHTVVTENGYRVGSTPGLAYVVVDDEGNFPEFFHGQKQFPGMMKVSFEKFVDRFGHLFRVSEVVLEAPSDPFADFFTSSTSGTVGGIR